MRADDKLVECRRLKEESTMSLARVGADLLALGQKRAMLDAAVTAATGAIAHDVQSLQHVQELFASQSARFKEGLERERALLKQREADANASLGMLEATGCSLLQRGAEGLPNGAAGSATFVLEACPEVLAPKGHLRLRLASGSAQGSGGAALDGPRAALLLQLLGDEAARAGQKATGLLPNLPLDADRQAVKKCFHAEHGCSVLHDSAAVLWSGEQELVDKTRHQIFTDQEAFDHFTEEVKRDMATLRTDIAEQDKLRKRAVEDNSRLSKQQAELVNEQARLEELSWNEETECDEKTINEILYDQVCSFRKLRDEMVRNDYPDVDIAEITDCYVGDWVEQACSSSCDPNLPPEDRGEAESSGNATGNGSHGNMSGNATGNSSHGNSTGNSSGNATDSGNHSTKYMPVGGNRTMRRSIIVRNSERGSPCPPLSVTYECNRKYCPVGCEVSEWDPWGECSAVCGGGIRVRSRNITRRPRYGGLPCKPLQETQGCNTGACDRDCALADWSGFSPCSMPCDTGVRERRRAVEIPAIGSGACPGESDPERLEREPCGAGACADLQTCWGSRDVALVVDSSGSLTEEGYGAIRGLAAEIAQAFQAQARQYSANLQLGAVLFGNGEVAEDGIMSDAVHVSDLSSDIAAVGEQISAQKWQAGVTNMAQGLIKAERVLGLGTVGNGTQAENRTPASVVLITDGRPAFRNQVDRVAKQLRKFARVVVVQVQRFPLEENVDIIKGFASEPADTHYLLIRGRDQLDTDRRGYARRVVARACQSFDRPEDSAVAGQSFEDD